MFKFGAPPSHVADSELSLSAYRQLCQLIYEHSRIFLGPHKQQLILSRLGKRRRELGLQNFDEYCKLLKGGGNKSEMDLMIDSICTNHTHFFRESVHFDLLKSQIIPDILKKYPERRQNLLCWSAASSSGEEPYTLAITLAELAKTDGPINWHIYASDISQRILEIAKNSIYDEAKLNLPSSEMLGRYFKVGSGPFLGRCKVRQELREHVQFSRVNLFDTNYPIPPKQSIIFCRNVLIYFDKPSQQQLISKLYDHLDIDGCLIIGHSESLLNIIHTFKPLGNGVYRRTR